MEQTIKKLGVERLSKDDVQRMQWEVLEAKIGNWIHFMRIAVRHSYVKFFFSLSHLLRNLDIYRDHPCYIIYDSGQTFICC